MCCLWDPPPYCDYHVLSPSMLRISRMVLLQPNPFAILIRLSLNHEIEGRHERIFHWCWRPRGLVGVMVGANWVRYEPAPPVAPCIMLAGSTLWPSVRGNRRSAKTFQNPCPRLHTAHWPLIQGVGQNGIAHKGCAVCGQ